MSLLLDALKRAEQEKLARQGEASNDAAPAAAMPAPERPKAAPAFELQPLSSGVGGGARGEEPAHAAQVLFDAKAPAEEKRMSGMLWATLAAIAVLVASAAAYVWYQIRVLSPAPAPVVARRPPPPPQVASGSPPPVTPLPDAARSPATVSVLPERPAPGVMPAEAAVVPRIPITLPTEDPVTRALREAPAAPATPPLALARTIDRPSISPDVSAGYAALRDGDLAEARRRYQAALAADPASVDARLGLATAEARAGDATLARKHYRDVLELDSRNATALAGLASLADAAVPEKVESQLREDVARFPESAPLRFALGSHYAAQRRWGEAQAAFYEAYRLDADNADILYNLAVSLDHVRQPRLAADFYRKAIEASRGQPTQFDPTPVRRRLAELTGR